MLPRHPTSDCDFSQVEHWEATWAFKRHYYKKQTCPRQHRLATPPPVTQSKIAKRRTWPTKIRKKKKYIYIYIYLFICIIVVLRLYRYKKILNALHPLGQVASPLFNNLHKDRLAVLCYSTIYIKTGWRCYAIHKQ